MTPYDATVPSHPAPTRTNHVSASRREEAPTSWRDRPPATRSPGAAPDGPVAYVMSRFPKLSETFVMNEIVAVEALGTKVEIFPLRKGSTDVVHGAADVLTRRAHYQGFFTVAVVAANLHALRRTPLALLRAWGEVLRGTWRSPRFLVKALVLLPKAAWFARRMQALGVRHVHAHFATHPTVAALVVHRLTGIPFSFTAHAQDINVDQRMLGAKIDAARFVIAISGVGRNLLRAQCGEANRRKVRLLHCGIDPDRFAAATTIVSRPRFTITCVARMDQMKGHDHLVAACRLLRDRGLDFVCHLVGDGPLMTEVSRRIAAAALGDRVIQHGGCVASRVADLLSASDAVVLASVVTATGRTEGIPVSLMEGMASGLPLVATSVGGVPELVEHGRTGLLVEPGDPVRLADAIEALAADPELRRRMGRAGREKVIREFNRAASARALVALFAASGAPAPGTVTAGMAIPAISR